MQIWVLVFVLCFGAGQFYQWVQHQTLPFPVMVLAGVLLAIASNADQWRSKWRSVSLQSVNPLPSTNPPSQAEQTK